jgi:hypothetical protein
LKTPTAAVRQAKPNTPPTSHPQTASTSLAGWQVALHLESEDAEVLRVVDCIEFAGGKNFYFFDILDAGPWASLAVGLIRGLIGSAGGLYEAPADLLIRLRRELEDFPASLMRIRALGIRIGSGSHVVEAVSVGWRHVYRAVPGPFPVMKPVETIATDGDFLNGAGSSPHRVLLELPQGVSLLVCSPGTAELSAEGWDCAIELPERGSALIALVKWREEFIAGRATKWPFPIPPLAWIRKT